MIQEAIHKVINRQDLTYEEAVEVMGEIMSGEASQIQMATFLTALRMKGETIEEITACAQGMRNAGAHIAPNCEAVEIVGTGGAEEGTFNISTTSAFVMAAAGVLVTKHGNRSVSSKSGAADVLEKLGANLMLDEEKAMEVLKKTNMVFLFAQKYHPAMRFVGGVRKEIGIRTLFNILGPLANPAGASMQLFGVYSEELVEPLAHVLHNLGCKRAMTIYGMDSIDEISLSADTKVCEFKGDEFKSYIIKPEDFGFTRCKKEDLVGGEPAVNAKIARDILDGAEGPKTDVVLLNAGAAIYLASDGITMKEGVEKAREIIKSGLAKKQLERFIEETNK